MKLPTETDPGVVQYMLHNRHDPTFPRDWDEAALERLLEDIRKVDEGASMNWIASNWRFLALVAGFVVAFGMFVSNSI